MWRLSAALVLALAAPAYGGAVVGVGVPFSAGELDDALAARDADTSVEVLAITGERVQIVDGDDRWDVELGGARGRVAARLVALHVVERGPSTVAAEVPAPAPRDRLEVWLTARIGLGGGLQADDLSSTTAGFDVASPGRLWVGVGGELERAFTADPDPGSPVRSRRITASLHAGIRLGRIQLGVGPLWGLMLVESAGSAYDHGVYGASAVARVRWPLDARWSIAAGLDASVFDRRVEVRLGGETIASTPRVSMSGSIGLTRVLRR